MTTIDTFPWQHTISGGPSALWDQFFLVESKERENGGIFDLSEYLAALALFLVIMMTSDFRYRYRLSLTYISFVKSVFFVGVAIGALILIVDVWYNNKMPVPKFMVDENNVKAILGFAFLTSIFGVVFVAFIRPPVFGRCNARRFFDSNYHYIYQGNEDRLQVVAEELRRSIPRIFSWASRNTTINGRSEKSKSSNTNPH